MQKRLVFSGGGLLLLAAAFLAFTIFNNLALGRWRIDLTENSLYTLSAGSREIIAEIDEPINLYFFFSDQVSEDLTRLRTYAERVKDMLEEYVLASKGKIRLHVIDPAPFSEEEDQASEFGLRGVRANTAGDELYFGLVATNSLDDQEIIPIFRTEREEFLEYDISNILQSLTQVDKPVLGLLSDLPVNGQVDPETQRNIPAWTAIDQLKRHFELQELETSMTSIPEAVDLLMLVHPKDLSDETLFAIDQYVMKGGKLVAFVDPIGELDQSAGTQPQPGDQLSELNRLTSTWGVELRTDAVLGDSHTAMTVGLPGGRAARHFAIQQLVPDNLSRSDITTGLLENLNVATPGILEISEDVSDRVEVLMQSSAFAMPLSIDKFASLQDPDILQSGFAPTGDRYAVAVRISGAAESAFPNGLDDESSDEPDAELLGSSEGINVVLVADTDILSDRLWVRVRNFLGHRLASPFADNGDFVTNVVENMAGSSALISVRSRGRFSRPFELVQGLRREAEARYRERQEALQTRLTETETKLRELQETRQEQNLLALSPEQARAVKEFQAEKLKIRKELRDVRHQLNKDIENLGGWLKVINIGLMPLLLTFGLFLLYRFVFAARRRA